MQTLDRSVLEWIATATRDAALSEQLAAARVTRRDFMRTGFFIYLDTDKSLPAVAAGVRPVCPHIASPELVDGAGCSLFLRDGYLHYLEIYARGGFIPEELEGFDLLEEV